MQAFRVTNCVQTATEEMSTPAQGNECLNGLWSLPLRGRDANSVHLGRSENCARHPKDIRSYINDSWLFCSLAYTYAFIHRNAL